LCFTGQTGQTLVKNYQRLE